MQEIISAVQSIKDGYGRIEKLLSIYTDNAELQSALIHEKEMRSKEADNYNKRIQELEAELRKYRAMA